MCTPHGFLLTHVYSLLTHVHCLVGMGLALAQLGKVDESFGIGQSGSIRPTPSPVLPRTRHGSTQTHVSSWVGIGMAIVQPGLPDPSPFLPRNRHGFGLTHVCSLVGMGMALAQVGQAGEAPLLGQSDRSDETHPHSYQGIDMGLG